MPNPKVTYVLKAGQTRPHKCHWPGCEQDVPPAMWGCPKHWKMLPARIRTDIWRSFRPGQEVDMQVSNSYLKAAKRAQDWIIKRGLETTMMKKKEQ